MIKLNSRVCDPVDRKNGLNQRSRGLPLNIQMTRSHHSVGPFLPNVEIDDFVHEVKNQDFVSNLGDVDFVRNASQKRAHQRVGVSGCEENDWF